MVKVRHLWPWKRSKKTVKMKWRKYLDFTEFSILPKTSIILNKKLWLCINYSSNCELVKGQNKQLIENKFSVDFYLQWWARRSTTIYIVHKQIGIIVLAVNEIEPIEPSYTREWHFLVQIHGWSIVRYHMQICSSACWNSFSISSDLSDQCWSWRRKQNIMTCTNKSISKGSEE